jgi:iron complex transport system permease protein
MDFIKLQLKRISFIYEKRTLLIILVVLLFSLILFGLSLGFGETKFSLFTVYKALFQDLTDFSSLIIRRFRLPRTLAAFLVGASLALAGSIIQSIVKNPLASPDLIGISSGGLFGTLLFLSIFTDPYANSLTVSIAYMPIFSFLGAVAATILVYFFAYKKGVTPFRLILIGIAISGAFTAINNLLIISGPLILKLEANSWLTGTVYGTTIEEVKILALWLLTFIIISIIFIRDLNVMNLDDKVVISLGSLIERKRLLLLLLSTAIASGAVAIGGAIGFIGLLAPHICRKLVNNSFGNIMPLTLLVGGMMVVTADLIGRTIFYPIEVPSGVFTSLIGAPFFMYLLWKSK